MAEARTGRGAAGGKLILCGEHAVVYGHPAIALGVDRGTRVEVRPTAGLLHVVDADGDRIEDRRLYEAIGAVLEGGWEVRIESDLPVGRGMGSSAALAVALVRAIADVRGEALSRETVHERAFDVERVFHGNPSGIDHAVAARGGVVAFRRTPSGPVLRSLPVPSWSLAVLDSGSAGNTRALVAGVAARRPGIDPYLEAIGDLVREVEGHLHDRPWLGSAMVENHRLLQAIGVSTDALDDLVTLALRAGAHGAKLAGAGGGGVVIALADEPERVVAAARAEGIEGFVCRPVRGPSSPS